MKKIFAIAFLFMLVAPATASAQLFGSDIQIEEEETTVQDLAEDMCYVHWSFMAVNESDETVKVRPYAKVEQKKDDSASSTTLYETPEEIDADASASFIGVHRVDDCRAEQVKNVNLGVKVIE